MKSLKELYKIGSGPSSSHTMGPEKACNLFKEEYKDADHFKVVLYGSLSLTGRGHLTDFIIEKTLAPKKVEIIFNNKFLERHPNAMELFAYDSSNNELGKWLVYSVGGGAIEIEGKPSTDFSKDVYPHKYFSEIKEYCIKEGINLYEYAMRFEDKDILEYMGKIWDAMKNSVEEGLKQDGILAGGLNIKRKAKIVLKNQINDETMAGLESRLVSAYAFAVNEQNASAGTVVTAPTCGACGTVPAVLYYTYYNRGKNTYQQLLEALIVGGLVGNVVKHTASISGAEAGCQAEVGTACAMAAAARAHLYGRSIDDIESAAEIAPEHNLGLTCDPVLGLVQVPCIERNAIAANKAINACRLAINLSGTGTVTLDTVIKTMYQTGLDLQSKYRETSEGGLAVTYFHDGR